jgi:anaphase-promoting complex subunit 4
MDTNAFTSLAEVQLQPACRILRSACCPDKDLVILVSRLGGKDRLALWKIQGSKKWEVDVASDQNGGQEIVDVAWSPDGKFSFLFLAPVALAYSSCTFFSAQTIVVAHDPPCITLHSVQDGSQEGVLQIQIPANVYRRTSRVTRVSWFKDERIVARSSIPDIFRRNSLIVSFLRFFTPFSPSSNG